MKKQYFIWGAVGAVVGLGALTRLVGLDRLPPGLYGDEAAIGYNAYSILKTGKDEWGIRLPLQFRSFNDDKAPLAIYLTVPSIRLFGLNHYGVRLPSALLGTLTILTAFWLAASLGQSQAVGLTAAVLLAISPWHIHVSRAMFEANVSLAFFLLGAAVFAARPGLRAGLAGALFLGLSLYAYHPAKILAPAMAVLLVLFFQRSFKEKAVFLSVFGLVALPFLMNLLFGRGEAKFRETIIFRPDFVTGEIAQRVNRQRALSSLPFKVKSLVYNKPLELGKEFSRNYLKSYGEKEAIKLIGLNRDRFDLIFLQDSGSSPITYAFFAGIDPAAFQKTASQEFRFGDPDRPVRIQARRFGKVLVGSLLDKSQSLAGLPAGSLLFIPPDEDIPDKPNLTINDPSDGRSLYNGYVVGSEYQERVKFN